MTDLISRAGLTRSGEWQPISVAPTSEVLRLRAVMVGHRNGVDLIVAALRRRDRLAARVASTAR